MLHYHTIPVTAFQQNCSLVWCDQTLEAAFIDPGGDLDHILEGVQSYDSQMGFWLAGMGVARAEAA